MFCERFPGNRVPFAAPGRGYFASGATLWYAQIMMEIALTRRIRLTFIWFVIIGAFAGGPVFASDTEKGLFGAVDPIPVDGRYYIDPADMALNWLPPYGNPAPVDHYVVLLDRDFSAIANPAGSADVEGRVPAGPAPSFALEALDFDRAYFWRVDTVLQDETRITGPVWTFVTEPIDIPGIVINYSSDPVTQYLMSPSLIILPDGTYLANHEYGGPWSSGHPKQTLFWESRDQGRSWRHIGTALDQYWSSTFYHDGALYLMGIDGKGQSSVTIRRSDDNGATWTDATDETTGFLLDGKGLSYHTGPAPVAIHNGRIWRGMEDRADPGNWGFHFRAFVMSAPVDSDLLDAASWTCTNQMSHDEINWTGTGWLEGNAIVNPDGELVNVLRVSSLIPSLGTVDTAAVMRISDDGATATFDPENDFIDMPGAGVKFVIRYDDETGLYWTLSNPQKKPYAMRNRLVLCSSPDLRNWTRRNVILESWDILLHAWQYVDWRIDDRDMVFVSRTAHPMGHGIVPHGYHDANFFTFHRIEDFRDMLWTGDDDDDDNDTVDDDDDDNNDDNDDSADDDDAPADGSTGDSDEDDAGCCG